MACGVGMAAQNFAALLKALINGLKSRYDDPYSGENRMGLR